MKKGPKKGIGWNHERSISRLSFALGKRRFSKNRWLSSSSIRKRKMAGEMAIRRRNTQGQPFDLVVVVDTPPLHEIKPSFQKGVEGTRFYVDSNRNHHHHPDRTDSGRSAKTSENRFQQMVDDDRDVETIPANMAYVVDPTSDEEEEAADKNWHPRKPDQRRRRKKTTVFQKNLDDYQEDDDDEGYEMAEARPLLKKASGRAHIGSGLTSAPAFSIPQPNFTVSSSQSSPIASGDPSQKKRKTSTTTKNGSSQKTTLEEIKKKLNDLHQAVESIQNNRKDKTDDSDQDNDDDADDDDGHDGDEDDDDDDEEEAFFCFCIPLRFCCYCFGGPRCTWLTPQFVIDVLKSIIGIVGLVFFLFVAFAIMYLVSPTRYTYICTFFNEFCTLFARGCDGIPASGLTYNACGVCGGPPDCVPP